MKIRVMRVRVVRVKIMRVRVVSNWVKVIVNNIGYGVRW